MPGKALLWLVVMALEDGVLYAGKLYRVDQDLKRMTGYYA